MKGRIVSAGLAEGYVPPSMSLFPRLSQDRGSFRMKVYISGAMTGQPGHNFPAFNAAAERLRANGFEVVNPADNGIIEGWEWRDYLTHDLAQLLTCNALFMLPGWKHSRGALLEYFVGKELGFKILGDE